MESWCLSKHKSRMLIFMMMLVLIIFMAVREAHGVCIPEERKALLEIKASLDDGPDHLLPTWVDHGGISGGECCNWERIKCDTTTGRVTDLSLGNIKKNSDTYYYGGIHNEDIWPLNVSFFLHFKELRSLDLSYNSIGDTIMNTGFERLSSLRKLEILNLSYNHIESNIFRSLGALTSLKVLDIGYNYMWEESKDISEFPDLENLEVLDLSNGSYYGTFQMQGSHKDTILKKLKILNLRENNFNESIITSLRSLPSLKALDLSRNSFYGFFPTQELAHLTKLEKLDLSINKLNGTQSIQDCKSLLKLKRLESIDLSANYFNKSIVSCLSFLPSLKTLGLGFSLTHLEVSFPVQELAHLTNLQKLDLRDNGLNDTPSSQGCKSLLRLKRLESIDLSWNYFNKSIISCLSFLPSLRTLDLRGSLNGLDDSFPMQGLTSLHNLEILDLTGNSFVGSIPSSIQSLSSLRVVSLASNGLSGSLPPDHGLCKLKNLHELDLSSNNFTGNLPECFNMLSSLKKIDISSNQFTGKLPPSLIANLTSLEYVDFSHNQFEGSFSFSSLSNLTNLEVVKFESDNDVFEVETEEPVGWMPMFQLKGLVLSNCNMNRRKGSVSPSFLLHQHELTELYMSHNSLKGQFQNWLIENNTMLETLIIRNNSIGGSITMPLYRNANIRVLDLSRNRLTGNIPSNLQKFLPRLNFLNFSDNSLDGVIPSSLGDLSELKMLDLSHNQLSGEVPGGLLTNNPDLYLLILSNNTLYGQILSRNLSLGFMERLYLDSNCFTGKFDNEINSTFFTGISHLDISNNFFTGVIPGWITNSTGLSEFLVRNNSFEGHFPCGEASLGLEFLDISQNSFSGPIPSCLNWKGVKHLHLGSNRFIGSIPTFFRNLTDVLTLDIRNNSLSGTIPTFLGELSNLRILLLGKNNFTGYIPNQLCQLNEASLIDLSGNSLSGSIPSCLHNITGPRDLAFQMTSRQYSSGHYISDTQDDLYPLFDSETQDEVSFTTKSLSLHYKGNILDYMSGLDLSCNKLTGEIPPELGMLTQIRALNLSQNQLSGPIPVQFSNLTKIESLDLSSNCLSGNVPSELIKLKNLAVFNVSYNNLSGRLPEFTAQFGTFTNKSYEGNPLLCGLPLEKKCTTATHSPTEEEEEEEEESDEKWYDIDMASFYGSCGSTWFVFMLGFAAVLYTNPYWRRRWLYLVEECMYTCYYFLYDLVRKPSMLFRK